MRIKSAGIHIAVCVALHVSVCLAAAQDAREGWTYPLGNLLTIYDKKNADAFCFGPEEKVFTYLFEHDDYWIAQTKIPGVEDAVFEQLIINSREHDVFSDADMWMFAVHYPQGLGLADAAIQQYAEARYADILPSTPEPGVGPDPLTGSLADKVEDRQNHTGPDFLESYTTTRASGTSFRIHHETITYRISRLNDRFVSIIFTTHSYWGGAHDNWVSEVLSFDCLTGKRLALEDIVPNHDAKRPAIGRRLQYIFTGTESTPEEQNLSREFQALQSMFTTPMQSAMELRRMALAPEGLVFIFDPYEIAPFSAGTIQLLLPLDELETMGINTALWNTPETESSKISH